MARSHRLATILGSVCFRPDRVDEALQCFSESWHSEPKNLVALSWMARLQLLLGEQERALGLSAPLSNTQPMRPEDAIGQLTGLVILGKEAEALKIFNAAKALPWWSRESENVPSFALLNHLGAVCCARTGDLARAKSLWKKALNQNPNLLFVEENLSDLNKPPKERNGAWPLPSMNICPASGWIAFAAVVQVMTILPSSSQSPTSIMRPYAKLEMNLC